MCLDSAMSRIVLIHGFATGIRYSVFRPAHGADAGFSAFRSDIESGEVVAFRWDIKEEASFFQTLNPFYSWGVYRQERAIAEDVNTYRRLGEFLSREQPEIIVCHSMGCFLFFEYLKRERLPASVKHIVFNQADLPCFGLEFSSDVVKRVHSGDLLITNMFCFWDPTLWCAVLLKRSLLAGLIGLRSPLIQNKFFPLLKPINLHTAAIRSKRFRDGYFAFLRG